MRIIQAITGRRIADQLDDADAQRQLAAVQQQLDATQAQIADMGAERDQLRKTAMAANVRVAEALQRAETAERVAAAEVAENAKLRAQAGGALVAAGSDPRPPAVEGRERQLELEVARLKRALAQLEDRLAEREGREVSPA